MTIKDYPRFDPSNPKELIDCVRYIQKNRKDDVNQFNNLKNVFISGRRSDKIPTSSTDVTNLDFVGDFNVTASFAYFLIDNAGTAVWRRVAVASW